MKRLITILLLLATTVSSYAAEFDSVIVEHNLNLSSFAKGVTVIGASGAVQSVQGTPDQHLMFAAGSQSPSFQDEPTPYIYTVTGTDITNGGFTLSYTPNNPQRILIEAVSGCRQFYGLDYVVGSPNAANFVSWAGLGLSALLISGDKLLITYSN